MKLVKLKDNRYKIKLDDGTIINTYEDVILEENILYKKDIDDKLLEKINKKNNFYKIYTKTLKYVLTKIRSEKEINEYLDKQEIDNTDKSKIIKKLKDNRMIDNNAYYKSYISDRIRLYHDGPDKIKKELLSNNIEESKIDNELLNYYEDIKEILIKEINKKLKNNKESEYKFKQRMINNFINKGYKKDMIIDVLDNISINDSNSLDIEYKKLYTKLSKKYSDSELKYKLKNSLYQKGYKLDDIKKVIE